MKQKVKVLEINYMIWGCPKISGQRIPVIYKLVAMITHVGPSLNCGHYTATSSSWETLLESSLRTSASGPDDNATDVGTVGCVVIREGPKRERPMTRPQTDIFYEQPGAKTKTSRQGQNKTSSQGQIKTSSQGQKF